MSDLKVVTVDNLGPEFDIGVAVPNKITLIPGASVPGTSLAADFSNLAARIQNVNNTILPLPGAGESGFRFDVVSVQNDIAGMAAGTDGQIVLLFNTDFSEIDLLNNSTFAAAGERFFLPNRQQYDLREYSSVYLRYDVSLDGGAGGWHIAIGSID